MTLNPPRIPPADERTTDAARPARPTRPIWQAALIWLAGLAVLLVVVGAALRFVLLPALSGGANSPSAAEARLSTLQTQEALTPRATLAPPAAATVGPAATAQPTAAPTTAPTAARATPTPAITLQPTVAPELVSEVGQAYLKYFDVRAEALLNLDPSQLDDVAAGDALAGLQKEIEQDRSLGRAIRTDVVHNYTVISANSDDAQVADDYRDSSVFVDPASKEPLPGEVVPASRESAPEIKVVYQLHRFSGVWKVTGGQKYE